MKLGLKSRPYDHLFLKIKGKDHTCLVLTMCQVLLLLSILEILTGSILKRFYEGDTVITPSYRGRKRGTERLSNLFKVRQLMWWSQDLNQGNLGLESVLHARLPFNYNIY